MLDSKIQNKVINLPDDLNTSLTNFQTRLDNLSSDVTTGKTKIAEAITSKGISASPNDNFTTLCNKLNQITSEVLGGGNIDVKVLSSLPTVVKENQIVVISNNPGKVYINKAKPSNLSNNDIFIKIDMNAFLKAEMDSSKSNVKLPFSRSVQIINNVEVPLNTYLGINGNWELTHKPEVYLFEEGKGTQSILGGFKKISGELSVTDSYVRLSGIPNFGYGEAHSIKGFDFTNFKTLEIEASSGFTSFEVSVGNIATATFSGSNQKLSIDLTNINGVHNIVLSTTCNYNYQYGYLYNLKAIAK